MAGEFYTGGMAKAAAIWVTPQQTLDDGDHDHSTIAIVPADARAQLIRTLQHAYSGELAAAYAYRGHWRSVSDPDERTRIHEIEDDEWQHRGLVGKMLLDLGTRPLPVRELVFLTIGKTLGALCGLSGWFLPMYGAGKLERRNIVEYEDAARYALACGREDLIDCMIHMAEVEWEHERYFRGRIVGHKLLRIFPLWDAAPPKETIREAYRSAAMPRESALRS
jgi:demethoxyubiquinone hydroxylase (CLK1/Coq7/Cat5 family)